VTKGGACDRATGASPVTMARSKKQIGSSGDHFPQAAYWDTAGFGGGGRVKQLERTRGSFVVEIMYALFAAYALMWVVLIFIR